MPMKVMSTETGMEIAVTSVERIDSRKTRITITAKTRPSTPSTARLLIDSSMNGAWSKTTVSCVLLPSDSSMPGIRSCTSLETSTVLPAGDLVTAMVSEGSPLMREIPVTGSSVMVTSATSPSGVKGALPPSSGSEVMSSVEVMREPACTVRVSPFSVISPAGSSTPLESRASVIASVPRPAPNSASWFGVMVTRCVVAPSRLASLTPSSWRMSASELSRPADRSRGSRSLVTPIWMTGRSVRLNVSTWVSALSGSVDDRRLMACCTFCSEVAMSVP
jgi:hypothetical protein